MPAVLVLNAGSSIIKFALFPVGEGASPGPATLSGQIDGLGVRAHVKARDAAGAVLEDRDLDLAGGLDAQHREALARLLDWLASHSNGDRVVAAGHRVVHGGERFDAPAVVTPELLDVLKTFEPLAPLHQPYNLGAIRAVMAVNPAIVQVACFDTAFQRARRGMTRSPNICLLLSCTTRMPATCSPCAICSVTAADWAPGRAMCCYTAAHQLPRSYATCATSNPITVSAASMAIPI